jgi:hypothetical protein
LVQIGETEWVEPEWMDSVTDVLWVSGTAGFDAVFDDRGERVEFTEVHL